MGLDWIRIPKPRPGHEAEYARLREVARDAIEEYEGFDPPDWSMQTDYAEGEELAALLRLHEISVYPEETWDAFLAELWAEARDTLARRPEIPLPDEDRALLAQPSLTETVALLEPRLGWRHSAYDRVCDLLGDCRWRLTRYTARELHLLGNGWDDGFVWRPLCLAPGVYNNPEDNLGAPAWAADCLVRARWLRKNVCAASRKVVPALAGRSDAEIEADFQRWSEHRWRRTFEHLDACPVSRPAWVDALEAMGRQHPDDAPRYDVPLPMHGALYDCMEYGIAAFGVARWLEFWGSRGHGYFQC